MPLTLVTGPANAGKAELVMDAVRRHLAHGHEPMLVVPRGEDVEHYRRELAGEGACMGVEVLRFRDLMTEAVRRAGVATPTLGALARERLLTELAAEAGAPVSAGFAAGLAQLIGELQLQRVTPARLREALGALGAAGFAHRPLAELYARYRELLGESGRLDEEQRSLRALDELRRRPALWGERPVLLYGFDDLTPLQLDAIETLGSVVGADVTVSLAYEPGRVAFAGRAASFHRLAPLAHSHRALPPRTDHYDPAARAALSHLERALFEPGAGRVDPGAAVRLIEGADEREELALVAEQIAGLLGEGLEPAEIAVVTRTSGASADLLEEVFHGAAIPFSLRRRRRLADSAGGRALLALLRCVPAREGGAVAGEAADLLTWLRAPGVLARLELADGLEAALRRDGAVGAEHARAEWERRHWPLETIDRLAEAQRRGPAALAERAERELRRLFEAPRRGAAQVLAGGALDEGSALRAGRAALAELRELARVFPQLAPSSAAELARALEDVRFRSGPRHTRGLVAVLDPLALRARRVSALFVCGMQQGAFPAQPRLGSLLSSEERTRLAQASGLRLGEAQDALAAERYLLYAAVSRPERQLTLSWHACGEDGSAAARSLFVEDVCDVFDPVPAHQREPLRGASVRGPAPGAWRPAEDPGARIAALHERDGAVATRERIAPLRDEELLAELRSRTWSASSLECWIGCPVRWFVERMLRAEDLDPDAEPLARGALAHAALRDTLAGLRRQTGSARLAPARLALARELLGQALGELERERPLSVSPDRRAVLRRRLQADLDRYLEHAAASAARAQEGAQELEPRHLELEFGFPPGGRAGDAEAAGSQGAPAEGAAQGAPAEGPAQGELPGCERAPSRPGLPALDLGSGVRLRGRIDRVDVSADGAMAVVQDYKGRAASPASKWLGGGELQVALYMRAVQELLGVRAVGGFYQPLSGRDLRARGVVERGAGLALEPVAADEWEGGELRELLDGAAAAAREAAAEAGRGDLQARPRNCAWGGGCSYPTICRTQS